jgi:hypothetical protein
VYGDPSAVNRMEFEACATGIGSDPKTKNNNVTAEQTLRMTFFISPPSRKNSTQE